MSAKLQLHNTSPLTKKLLLELSIVVLAYWLCVSSPRRYYDLGIYLDCLVDANLRKRRSFQNNAVVQFSLQYFLFIKSQKKSKIGKYSTSKRYFRNFFKIEFFFPNCQLKTNLLKNLKLYSLSAFLLIPHAWIGKISICADYKHQKLLVITHITFLFTSRILFK